MTNEMLLEKIHLVAEKLMNLGGCDAEKDKSTDAASHKTGMIQRDFGIEEWDWPQGVGLYGLLKLQEYYGDNRYNEFFENWYQNNIKIGLPSKNVNTTAPFLALIHLVDALPHSEEYRQMCIDRAKWLMNGLPRTRENGFQHVTSAIEIGRAHV